MLHCYSARNRNKLQPASSARHIRPTSNAEGVSGNDAEQCEPAISAEPLVAVRALRHSEVYCSVSYRGLPQRATNEKRDLFVTQLREYLIGSRLEVTDRGKARVPGQQPRAVDGDARIL